MMRKRGGTRAQVTLFVILGLILLILFVMMYLFFSKRSIIKGPETIEAVPPEFKPLQNYVEGCVHKLAIQAVKSMGAHGGYIDPLDTKLTPVQLRFNSVMPTRFELASLTGDSSGAVPFYLYVPGDASFYNYNLNSLAPTIESMQDQLNAYISGELPNCVGEFPELEAQGFDVSPDNENITATTFIRDNKIEFIVKYPINASKEGVKTKISDYTDELRFPFKKYYDYSVVLMASELVSQFLESFTSQVINYNSGMSTSLLPPIIEYTDQPYIITWSNSKAKMDLDSYLQSYVPAIQVVNTSSYTPIQVEGEDEVAQKFFNSLSLELFNETVNESITFFYHPGTLYLKVQPSKGDLIRPSIDVDEGNQMVPKSQFNSYKFYYDVSYPVIVEVRGHEPGTEMEDYSYFFALEVNIIENKPAVAWELGFGTVDWDYSYINKTYALPEGTTTDEQTGETVEIAPRSMTKSLFCDEDTWLSGGSSITLEEEITTAPIAGATISFGCGDYQECYAGTTDENGQWTGKLPICTGGYISIVKEGYGSKNLMLTTQEGLEAVLGVQRLYKLKELNATVKKYQLEKVYTRNDSWQWEVGTDSLGVEEDINPEAEQVVVTLNQVGFEAGNNGISASIIFGKDGVETESISLVPGDYEVSIQLFDYNGITIPANCTRVCSDRGFFGIGCTGYTYFPDEIVMEQAPWGGLDISEANGGTFVITSGDLENANYIEFRFLKLPDLQQSNPPGACVTALEEMGKIAEYSEKYRDDLFPRIS